jgi:hypothetical protein
MKRVINYIFLLFPFSFLLTSCAKENTTKQFTPFYKLTVNGSQKIIDACGTTDYVASYLKDTAVFATFGCGGQGAGFYLKGQSLDGTYLLNDKNKAWFDEGGASYITDNLNGGTLTIKMEILKRLAVSFHLLKGHFLLTQ